MIVNFEIGHVSEWLEIPEEFLAEVPVELKNRIAELQEFLVANPDVLMVTVDNVYIEYPDELTDDFRLGADDIRIYKNFWCLYGENKYNMEENFEFMVKEKQS